MYCLLDVLSAVLYPVPSHVFHHTGLAEIELITLAILCWLNGKFFVVIATDLVS